MIHCSIFLCGCLLHSVSQLFRFLLNIFTVFISCFVVCFNFKMCFKKRAAAWALFLSINFWMNYNRHLSNLDPHFCSTTGINCWPSLYVIIDMESHFPSPNNDLNMILCTSPPDRTLLLTELELNHTSLSCTFTSSTPLPPSTTAQLYHLLYSRDKQKCCDATRLPTACVSSTSTKEFVGVKEVLSKAM